MCSSARDIVFPSHPSFELQLKDGNELQFHRPSMPNLIGAIPLYIAPYTFSLQFLLRFLNIYIYIYTYVCIYIYLVVRLLKSSPPTDGGF